MARVFLALLLLAPVVVGTATGGASPVQKVLELMNDIMVKAKQEKQDEKVRFAAFSEFCKVTTVQKAKAIEKGQADIDAAEADIEEATSAATGLAQEIAGHYKDMAMWDADKEQATALRAEAHKLYQKTHMETVDAIESTKSAEDTLGHGNEGVAQGALLQLAKKPRIPDAARHAFVSFAQDPATSLLQSMGAPQAAAYEGSSSTLIEVVVSVEDKLKAEKKDLEDREANSLNAFNLQMASLEGSLKKAKAESEFKAGQKAGQDQAAAAAKGALADATSTRAEDIKYRKDLVAECALKTKDFHKRQEMRKGELEAIEKAMAIMSSPEAAAGAQHTSLAQGAAPKAAGKALAQLRTVGAAEAERRPSQGIASRFLADKAQKLNSHMLSLLATRAAEDPFAKVTKMVKDMIQRLMEQANDEADHKAFCDTEMGTNKMTRDTKTELVSSLEASIEELTADISKRAQTAVQIQAAISELDGAMEKATKERAAEKAKNQATIADSKGAQAATQKAIAVLKEYYETASNQVDLPEAAGPIKYDPRSLVILSKAGGGASLTQTKQKVPGAPEMESGKYTGADSGGVVGILEVFESDLAAVVTATEGSEQNAVRAFEEFATDTSKDKAVKQTDLEHQMATKTAKESDLQAAKTDLKSAKEELQAATDYYEKLKPSCVEVAVSYEDRVAARKEEVESLQEALTILGD